MNPTLNILSLLSVALMWTACGGGGQFKNELKPYYFPLDSLGEGVVYEYKDTKNEMVDHFCVYSVTKNAEGKRLLVNRRFNAQYQQDMQITEREVLNGMVCQEYIFMVTDSTGKTTNYPATIKENVVFPFDLTADKQAPYRFIMDFALPPDTDMKINYTRNRRFSAYSEFVLDGKTLPTVIIDAHEAYEVTDTTRGGEWLPNGNSVEMYAEGVGLVFCKKQALKNLSYAYRLSRRVSLAQFEKERAAASQTR